MTAYYNEVDPYAADWLENLIADGLIAPGVVDRRDIRDVRPSDLAGFTQCHFYAGIGVWSYSLRRGGWKDDRAVWTFSEPCQPFSAAGRRGGVADERYLRPYTHHLVRVCRPPVVFGEQVASKDGLGWLDTVSADMEGEGYAFWAQDRCSAGVTVGWEESQAEQWLRRTIRDCPDPRIASELRDFADWARGNIGEGGQHIRQRLYFVGVADDAGERWVGRRTGEEGSEPRSVERSERFCDVDGLDHHHQGSQGYSGDGGSRGGRPGQARPASEAGISDGLADGARSGRREEYQDGRRCGSGDQAQGVTAGHSSSSSDIRLVDADQPQSGPEWEQRGWEFGGIGGDQGTGATPSGRSRSPNSIRHAADWLFCRDGKWRPVGPGSFPLAHGATSRVGKLRAFGNAIDAENATEFVEIFLEHEREASAAVPDRNGSLTAFEDLLQ